MAKIEENVKLSFVKVKEHIDQLERELKLSRELLIKQTDVIKLLSTKLDEIKENPPEIQEKPEELQAEESTDEPPEEPIFLSSSGNKGVNQSINQSINQQSEENIRKNSNFSGLNEEIQDSFKHSPKHLSTSKQSIKQLEVEEKPSFQQFKTELNETFSCLSKQELKVFLSLYQLEEEIMDVSYTDLAKKMKLTEACIRGYVSGLIKKKVPILRSKLNNRRTILKINPHFKDLNLKQRLISLYYNTDPFQTRLFDQN